MCIKEFIASAVMVTLIGVGLFTFVYGFSKGLKLQKNCIESGYINSYVYLDGTAYCSRKGALGQDEIVRIK